MSKEKETKVDTAFRITESDETDETISTLSVMGISYELVVTEDHDKYVFSSSALFRKGFKVNDSAEKLVLIDDLIMIQNEDESFDELLVIKEVVKGEVIHEYKTHVSTRGIPLVYRYNQAVQPVITIENTGKWYKLFVVGTDGSVSDLDVAIGSLPGFDDWIDHCPKPDDLVVYAEKIGFFVDEQSLEMMIGRIVIEKDYVLDNSFGHDNIISKN